MYKWYKDGFPGIDFSIHLFTYHYMVFPDSKIICPVIPEVEITATFTRVKLGENLTLTCSVIRGNPTIYNYSVVHINTTTTTSEPTRILTGIQVSDLGTYRCDVTNDAGTGSANITIELGGIYI